MTNCEVSRNVRWRTRVQIYIIIALTPLCMLVNNQCVWDKELSFLKRVWNTVIIRTYIVSFIGLFWINAHWLWVIFANYSVSVAVIIWIEPVIWIMVTNPILFSPQATYERFGQYSWLVLMKVQSQHGAILCVIHKHLFWACVFFVHISYMFIKPLRY